ncbi:MAG: glycosyltransferase family 9 protein [Candidatus Omnitrophica bacterium]|nr:glycosyltransferase family 9 protein [Candidatus Omnitrophota bacterium]
MKKIAILRALLLGDLLCLVPSLRALRKALPKSEVTLIGLPWAASFARRFSHYIDRFMEFPGYPGLPERKPDMEAIQEFIRSCRRQNFDLALQMHGDGTFVNTLIELLGAKRTAGFYSKDSWRPHPETFTRWPEKGHEIRKLLGLLKFLGIPPSGEKLEFPVYEQDKEEFLKIKEDYYLKDNNYICLHPGARFSSRRWDTGKFASLAQRLVSDGHTVVATGTKKEEKLIKGSFGHALNKIISLAGKTSLGSLALLLKNARLLITNDTGVSHLAAAMKTKSLVIVTGSDPARWAPLNHRLHPYIFHPVSCRPCPYVNCPFDRSCSSGIPVKNVYDLCNQSLA